MDGSTSTCGHAGRTSSEDAASHQAYHQHPLPPGIIARKSATQKNRTSAVKRILGRQPENANCNGGSCGGCILLEVPGGRNEVHGCEAVPPADAGRDAADHQN